MDTSQFHGKTVAVVGNSKKLLDFAHGAAIDDHDLVIRFNRAWPNRARNRKATGSKTTHMSLVIRKGYAAMIERNKHVQFFLPMPPPVRDVPNACALLPQIGREALRACKAELDMGNRPSSGVSVLWFLLNYTAAKRITIYGMDGMKTGKWYETKPHWNGHNKDSERAWLASIANNPRVDFVSL